MAPTVSGTPNHVFLRDGATIAANVNGSITPVTYAWTAPATHSLFSLEVFIQDGGTFDAGIYGGLAAGLTNGLGITVGGGDILDGQDIQTNADFVARGFEIDYHDIGAGDSFMVARLKFADRGGPVQVLTGQTVAVTVNDDLLLLTDHSFMIFTRATGGF